jgi:hypothetical protein
MEKSAEERVRWTRGLVQLEKKIKCKETRNDGMPDEEKSSSLCHLRFCTVFVRRGKGSRKKDMRKKSVGGKESVDGEESDEEEGLTIKSRNKKKLKKNTKDFYVR